MTADRGTYRGRWLAEVFRTPLITDTTRVMLLALAEDMDESGYVSVPRGDLAELLDRSPRKVTERIRAAVDAGFLERAIRGQKHRTAVYRGTSERLRLSETPGGPPENSQVADPQHPETDSQVADPQHPEKSQVDPRGSSREALRWTPGGPADYKGSTYGTTDNVVVGLFREEEKDRTISPAARAAAPGEVKPITAQTVVAAYVDGVREATGEDPTGRLIGQVGRQAKELIQDERRDKDRLVVAARSLGTKVARGFTDLGREYLMSTPQNAGSAATAGRAPWDPNYTQEEYLSGF